jgi:hypothetical protein
VGIGACVVWFSIQGAGEGSSKITAIIRIFLNYLQGCALLRAMSSQGPPIASRFLETAAVGTVSITSVGAPPPMEPCAPKCANRSVFPRSMRTAVCEAAQCAPSQCVSDPPGNSAQDTVCCIPVAFDGNFLALVASAVRPLRYCWELLAHRDPALCAVHSFFGRVCMSLLTAMSMCACVHARLWHPLA